MKNLGQAKRILGMDILRDLKVGKLFLYQGHYSERVLSGFNMNECKPLAIPLGKYCRLMQK